LLATHGGRYSLEMRRLIGLGVLASLAFGCGTPETPIGSSRAALAAGQSELWGEAGELFVPTGRLMDWSYAGYRAGEEPLPMAAASIDVTTSGATANDASDDTAAFADALASAGPGDVVFVPEGRFVISDADTPPPTRPPALLRGLDGAGGGPTIVLPDGMHADMQGGSRIIHAEPEAEPAGGPAR